MNKFIIISILAFCSQILTAQNLGCPADVTVDFSDFDAQLNYGVAEVFVPQPYTLTIYTEETFQDCENGLLTIFVKTFHLTHGTITDTCQQTISVKHDDFDDYPFPDSLVTLYDVDAYNIDPAVSGYWIPPGTSGVVVSDFTDQVLHVTQDTFKVLRKWVALNWCTTETQERYQVINVYGHNGYLPGNDDITTFLGKPFNVYEYRLLDNNGIEITNANCVNTSSILEHINCIYNENNNIGFIQLELSATGPLAHYLNGVSSLDLVLIQRHILGIMTIDDPFQLKSADVNNDDRVSAIDLVELRKLILGIYDVLPKSDSWNFYNKDYNKDLIFNNFELPLQSLRIVAVKVGDVNGSAQ